MRTDTWCPASFDTERLRGLLSSDIEFEGPLTGRTHGIDAFVAGLERFVRSLSALRVVQMVQNGNEAAVLYDCDLTMPEGTFRFAEFIRVDGDKIRQDTLVFDTVEFRKAAAAAPASG
jgi:hypothetical protein